MKRIIISYFDKKLGVYSDPISVNFCSTEDLVEQTRRMCSSTDMPEVYFDYELYTLGSFDDKTGLFVPSSHPEFVVALNDFRYLREVKKDVCES